MSRKMGPEDEALWQAVTQSVTPLRDRPAAAQPVRPRYRPQPLAEPDPPAGPGGGAVTPQALDRHFLRGVARGKTQIDRVLDLHGMTQDRAHAQLRHAVLGGHRAGQRVLLVITGKGGRRFAQTGAPSAAFRTRADFAPEGGVLKRQVPLWLTGPELAPFVHSFGAAADAHGGAGALYVRLRRRR